jgi:lysophospholipase L1-like esterase
MLPRSLLALLSALLLAATVGAQAPATLPSADASVGVPKVGNAAFFEKHEAFLKRAKAGPIGLLFLGDSITEGWKSVPELWEQQFGRHQPANFGIGGDQTQHVIWRLENGELEGIDPRVVVLMIGTNNSGAHTAPEIAAANRKIVQLIRSQLPQTKVLLLAIFPRGPRVDSRGVAEDGITRMAVIRDVNTELARLDDGRMVRFLDLGPRFLGPDGKIPLEVMPDQLHLSPLGYRIWADGMQPLLHEMLR